MVDAIELKPCPFCGGEAYLVRGAPETWARCKECSAGTDTTSNDDRAAAKWNTRSADPRITALESDVSRLTAENAELREALAPFAELPDSLPGPKSRFFLQLLVCPAGSEVASVDVDYGLLIRKARTALSTASSVGGNDRSSEEGK